MEQFRLHNQEKKPRNEGADGESRQSLYCLSKKIKKYENKDLRNQRFA